MESTEKIKEEFIRRCEETNFSPHHDRDIGKVVRAASRAAGRSLRDERAQLRATIRGCADAERIYDIRCRIVHTKDDGEKDEVGLLLPFSPAARKLTWDINLLERIARQALIHASRPLVVDT